MFVKVGKLQSLPFLPIFVKRVLIVVLEKVPLLVTLCQNLTPEAQTPSHCHHHLCGLLLWPPGKPLLPFWTFWIAFWTLYQIRSLQSTEESALGKRQDWKDGMGTSVLSGIHPKGVWDVAEPTVSLWIFMKASEVKSWESMGVYSSVSSILSEE